MNKDILKKIIFTGLFLVPFIPFLVSSIFFFPFITTKAFAWRVIIEIVFAVWILLALIDVSYRPKKSIIAYAVVAFLFIIGIADLFGVAPAKSFWSNFERMEGFVTLLHLGMFFIVMGSVFREVDWKRWWNTSLVASFLMIIYCVLQLIGINTIHQGGVRLDGTLGNAIYLAVYMLFHIFIAVLLLWRERKNVFLRWVYGILIFLQGLILYYTATRGAILGLLGGIFIVAVLNIFNKDEGSKVVKKIGITTLASLIILVGIFVTIRKTDFVTNNPVLSRFSSLTTEEIKTQGRYFVWPIALKGIKERPILGWGQENFNYIFNEHYIPEMYKLEPWFDRAHNIFLDWAVSGGLLGLLSYLALYFVLLFSIWKQDASLSHVEKSILTGLVAAYFFHNFFVFDHLISYILFFSILSYIYSRTSQDESKQTKTAVLSRKVFFLALPVVSIALLATLYFVNVQPFLTNTRLLSALVARQPEKMDGVLVANLFKSAYESSYLGRSEVIEQIATNASAVLASDTSIEEKNRFFNFSREAVIKQAEDLSDDARYQLVAGSFLSTTGFFEEALIYFERAKKLMPGKQMIHLQIAETFLNKGDKQKAIDVLLHVGEISPDHKEQMDEYIRQINIGN